MHLENSLNDDGRRCGGLHSGQSPCLYIACLEFESWPGATPQSTCREVCGVADHTVIQYMYTVLIMSSVGCKSKKEKIMTKTKVRNLVTFYLEKNLLEVQHRESVRSVVYVNHVYWASLKAGGYQRELWEYKTSWCFDKLSSSFEFSFSNGNSKKHEENKKCFSYTQYKGIICRLQTLK